MSIMPTSSSIASCILYSAPKQNYFAGKASLAQHSTHDTRASARSTMNRLRHVDPSQLYVIWDGNTLVSSTL